MLKILHIIQGYGGGISSLVKNLILSSDKSVVTQDVLSFAYIHGEAFIDELTAFGSKVMQMPRPRKDGYKAFKKYVLNVMREGKYDVVHCHSDGWRSSIFKNLSHKAGVKLFCIHAHRTTNNPGFILNCKPYIKLEQLISRKNADVRFTCGREAARFIYGTAEKSVTIPNGIDMKRCHNALEIDKSDYQNELSIAEDELTVLHAGRFVSQKNHMFIIDIAEKLRDKGIKFRFLLAGTGDLYADVEAKIKEKKLEEHVMLLGRRNDIYELMSFSDAMILPSVSEGLPTVAVEAQAMGLYSLVSNAVTEECDMGVGLVEFLPINNMAELWADALIRIKNNKAPEREAIDKALEDNAYTATGAVDKYLSTLNTALNR